MKIKVTNIYVDDQGDEDHEPVTATGPSTSKAPLPSFRV